MKARGRGLEGVMKAPWPETQREDLPATRNSCWLGRRGKKGKAGGPGVEGSWTLFLSCTPKGKKGVDGRGAPRPRHSTTAAESCRAGAKGAVQGASVCRGPTARPAPGETPGLQHNLGIRAGRTSARAEINCHAAGQGGKWKRN